MITGSKADGDAYEARLRLELEAEGLSKRTAPTFSSFCVHVYRPYAETNLKASTWQGVRVYQVATLTEFFGAYRLTDVKTDLVESYKRVRSRSVGPTAINNELRVLRTILNYASDAGYPAARPKIVKLRQRGKPRVKTWTLEELDRLFHEARRESLHLMRMLVFLANTGCRKGEAIACEWNWVDFDADMIRIPSNEVWQPKNGLPREVPMSDACRAILTGEPAHERWVFPRTRFRKGTGGRYTAFPKDAFWEARDRAGIKGGPHTLRHTFASQFLQRKPDLFLLAKVLGHSHQRVTELYTHLLPEHLAEARNVVNIGPSLQRARKVK